jgi:hypothetical protein
MVEHQRRYGHGEIARIWFLVLLLATGLLGLGPVPAASQAPAVPEPAVLRADGAGVVLEWRAPAFSVRQVTGDDGRPYSSLEAPGWPQADAPGQPRLPFASALAVVPPTGDVTLHVQALEPARRPLPHPVVPARAPVPVGDPPTRVEWEWALDEQAYAGKGPHPANSVTLEEAGWQRGRRLVRLTFHPLRFDPAGGALEVARRVRVELRFEGHSSDGTQAGATSEGGWAPDDPFIPVLQSAVVNPAYVTRFARPGRSTSAAAAAHGASASAQAGPGAALDETGPARALAGPPGGADYLIIAHSDFMTAVAPLAAHRATGDGLRVFSTDVQAIYDAYSGGAISATAIKEYIADAYENWTLPRLSYVLLVGDGTEPQGQSPTTDPQPTYVPPYLIPDPWIPGELTPSDNQFVTLDEPDNVADVFIGRLPVNSAAETTAVVEKILAYELDPPQWPWNERVLFFADAPDPQNPAEAFHQDSDDIYHNHLRPTFTGRRVYFCTSDCGEPHLYDDMAAAHDATVRELNGGGLIASYVGHSSWHQWAVDPVTYAPMFHVSDVAGLHNGGALPVFLELTCYTSRFSHPTDDTLDESLLRRAGGGAVATWGPTTWGSTEGHHRMHEGFFDVVFDERPEKRITKLGPATEAAKDRLTYALDLRDTFVLLGDPAMDLNLDIVPWAHEVYLPVTVRRG